MSRNGTKVVTGEVRFSYLTVFTPRAVSDGDTPKYSVSLLIPKTNKKQVQEIKDAIEEAEKQGKAKFGQKWKVGKLVLKDGDEERPDNQEYAGMMFVNANSASKPMLFDKRKQAITEQEDMYSGCYGSASVNFFPYNQKVNQGVACGLNALQKWRDGDSLDGQYTEEQADQDFDTIDEDEDDEI